MKIGLQASLAVIALSVSAPAFADDGEIYWKEGGWSVLVNELNDGTPYCGIVAIYGETSALGLQFVPSTNVGTISFILPMIEAANFSPSEKYNMTVDFVDGNSLDDGWGELEFSVANGADNNRVFMSSNMDAEVLMNDLAEGDAVGFSMYDGNRLVASFSLKGSSTAVKKLRDCGYSRVID